MSSAGQGKKLFHFIGYEFQSHPSSLVLGWFTSKLLQMALQSPAFGKQAPALELPS